MNITKMHLPKSKYTNPQIPTQTINWIVIHYTGASGQSDTGLGRYWEILSDPNKNKYRRYASSNYGVDKDSITEYIEPGFISYHAANRYFNYNSIGIEMCIEKDNSLHQETIRNTVTLCSDLCLIYSIIPRTNIIRHFDIKRTNIPNERKNCPLMFVEDPQEFFNFRAWVDNFYTQKKLLLTGETT